MHLGERPDAVWGEEFLLVQEVAQEAEQLVLRRHRQQHPVGPVLAQERHLLRGREKLLQGRGGVSARNRNDMGLGEVAEDGNKLLKGTITLWDG